MEIYRKPAIAAIRLNFADGIKVFPSVPEEIGFDHRTATTRVGIPAEFVHDTLRSKENDHHEI
jgi:hypothetical protein